MMTQEDAKKLKELAENLCFSKEMKALKEFSTQHKGEGVSSFPSTERALDDIIQTTAMIIDELEGVEFGGRKSLLKKIRKALGYTFP